MNYAQDAVLLFRDWVEVAFPYAFIFGLGGWIVRSFLTAALGGYAKV